jgi:hypothetical protein
MCDLIGKNPRIVFRSWLQLRVLGVNGLKIFGVHPFDPAVIPMNTNFAFEAAVSFSVNNVALELRVHCVNHPVLFLHTSPCVFPSQKVGVDTTIARFDVECGEPK